MPAPLDAEVNSAIAHALARVRGRIDAAARGCGRSPDEVTLVAVSKTHPSDSVAAALDAGQRCFGENRVQEAAAKFPALRTMYSGLRLHLIGGLQTNKVIDAVRIADVIETLDREKLADAVESAAQRAGRLPQLLVQVNIGNEAQKAGVPTAAADAFVEHCRRRFGPALHGLMCIPPEGQSPDHYFASLAAMRVRHRLPVLSMGMSQDFEAAILLGATHVRVGSAIFGQRGAASGGVAVQHTRLQPSLQAL